MTVAVINYGMGNIGSIRNMLNFIGADHIVSEDPREIASADRIILPGVGHFDLAMSNLFKRDLVAPLRDAVLGERRPILGICLGQQLLCGWSEEGNREGLGFVDAEVRRIVPPEGSPLKVPHMGWSQVQFVREDPLIAGLGSGRARFYFVHAYSVRCRDEDDVLGVTDYGGHFVSAFKRGNIAGVQFHPEKSHRYGIQLFRNFVAGEEK